jgi:aerobic carbon-monoxide dehydrogenase large subunit
MDGTIEAVARALNLDPIAVRRRNMLTAAELPWTMPAGPTLEDVTPRETLDAALVAFDVPGFRARQEADRARGVYRGMGLCCVVESNTYGSAFYRAAGIPGSAHEAGWVKVAPSGAVDVSVGLMTSGQGYETALSTTCLPRPTFTSIDPGGIIAKVRARNIPSVSRVSGNRQTAMSVW